MEENEGRALAVTYAQQQLGYRDAQWLAQQAHVDVSTVRDFLAGRRWPRTKTREAIEEVLGIERGRLKAIAQGWDLPPASESDQGDAIEAAINASSDLTRAQKLRLRAVYVEMLEGGAASEEVRGA